MNSRLEVDDVGLGEVFDPACLAGLDHQRSRASLVGDVGLGRTGEKEQRVAIALERLLGVRGLQLLQRSRWLGTIAILPACQVEADGIAGDNLPLDPQRGRENPTAFQWQGEPVEGRRIFTSTSTGPPAKSK